MTMIEDTAEVATNLADDALDVAADLAAAAADAAAEGAEALADAAEAVVEKGRGKLLLLVLALLGAAVGVYIYKQQQANQASMPYGVDDEPVTADAA